LTALAQSNECDMTLICRLEETKHRVEFIQNTPLKTRLTQ